MQVEWEKLTKAGWVKIEDIGQDLLVTKNKVPEFIYLFIYFGALNDVDQLCQCNVCL